MWKITVRDLILIQSPQRTNIITCEDGKIHDYRSFNDYGDVIIYQPNGISSATPIMHRAISWVEKGEEMPNGEPAPHEGYITKGDNNPSPDQSGLGIEPVKPEWVIGVARVRIPYLGASVQGCMWHSYYLRRDIRNYCGMFNEKEKEEASEEKMKMTKRNVFAVLFAIIGAFSCVFG